MISVEEAFQLIEQSVLRLPCETIALGKSVGRVIAADVVADVDSPPHHKSVMDGFAVQSADIRDGRTKFQVLETIVAGTMPTQTVVSGTCSRIMTGAPMPAGADAVVMVELSNVGYSESTPNEVMLTWNGPLEDFRAGKHAMRQADNFARGAIMFKRGHWIRPTDVGLLAEVGMAEITVYRQPSVAVAPTGDELVDCSAQPDPSQIRNSNGPMLRAICESHGLQVTDLGIGADRAEEIEKRIRAGLKHEILLLSGGVSAGTLDLVPGILKACGVEEIYHKVKVKPGKPVFFGVLVRADGSQCVVFGLPGNPVSSLVGMHLFVSTAIRIMAGNPSPRPIPVNAVLSAEHHTRGDRPTYWPARTVLLEELPTDHPVGAMANSAIRLVEPLPWNGSSDLLALGSAEGLMLLPPRQDAWPVGQVVEYFPFDVMT